MLIDQRHSKKRRLADATRCFALLRARLLKINEHPPIDQKGGAGDVAGEVGGKEDDATCHIFRLTHAP
jgi:hypothetical protein